MKFFISFIFIFCACEKPQERHLDLDITSKIEGGQSIKTVPASKAPPVVISARNQIGVTTSYDPKYVSLKYPGGDVPANTGVCTDVVIRALRESYQMDLQKLVHEDMKRAFSKYPDNWGLSRPDKNIDHRRVPNLRCFFRRSGYELKKGTNVKEYLAGDIITCLVGNRPHIMIVSNRKLNSLPLVIHNIGSGTKEEDSLMKYKITGHYRINL